MTRFFCVCIHLFGTVEVQVANGAMPTVMRLAVVIAMIIAVMVAMVPVLVAVMVGMWLAAMR